MRFKCQRSVQAAGNSPDPSLSPPLEGSGNQTSQHYNFIVVSTMAGVFERAITYALQRLGCKAMTLKLQQRASVKYIYEVKEVFLQVEWIKT